MSKKAFKLQALTKHNSTSRREFLRFTGVGLVTTGLFLSGCTDDDPNFIDIKAPSKLTAVQKENGDVLLSWLVNSTNEEGFVVQRSTSSGGTFIQIGPKLAAGTSSYLDLAAEMPKAGAIYYYRVAAYVGNQSSPTTAVVSSMGGAVLVNAGVGDVGVLNYLYALKQVEQSFFQRLINNQNFAVIFSNGEQNILRDVLSHTTAHSDFFRQALLKSSALPALEVDFSSVDLSNKGQVLAAAKALTNTAVAASNGAGQLFTNSNLVLIAAKIASVSARHAAVISNMLNPGTTDFASTINSTGLDQALTPAQALTALDTYMVTRIDINGLPAA